MRHALSRLFLLGALLLSLAACGSKGPLVQPTDEPAKSEQPAQ
jgi:predicted small lipoprotein YifL